jgi:hypothetical protein
MDYKFHAKSKLWCWVDVTSPSGNFREIATVAKLLHMLKHPLVLPFASTLAWLRAYTGHSKAVVELSMRLPSSHQKVAQLIQGAVQLNGAIDL